MGNFIDLTGQRFGRLTVIERAENTKYGTTRWFCKCDCGEVCIVRAHDLKRGASKSCGCFRRENTSLIHTVHAKRATRLYRIWCNMKSRCYNPRTSTYSVYGGRGIGICKEWKDSFQPFYDWAMAHGYQDDLSIDRINNEKGYTPENCRWATRKTQGNNRRTNHNITFHGETHTITEWAEITGIGMRTIKMRLIYGWPIERILTEPVHTENRHKT